MSFKKNAGKNNAGNKKPVPTRSTGPTAPPPTITRQSTVEGKPVVRNVTTQSIAEAAYFLWLQNGGDEISNWLKAEAMLRAGSARG